MPSPRWTAIAEVNAAIDALGGQRDLWPNDVFTNDYPPRVAKWLLTPLGED